MATQGLFTQGPSVEDLLAKRNKRSFDLQQTLMQQAAQGARDPAKAQAISLLGSSLGRALAGSMDGGKDAEVEKIQAQQAAQKAGQQAYFAGLQTNTSAAAMEAAGILQENFPAQSAEMIQVAQKRKKEEEAAAEKQAAAVAQQQRREALISAANKLKLTSTVELLSNGGDLDEAAKQIRKQEEIQVAARGGRKGKVTLAQQRGKDPEFIRQVAAGDYDGMVDAAFTDLISGKKADNKAFTKPDGSVQFFREDEQGLVYNDATQSWVNASSLGLTQAPQLTKEVKNQFDVVTEALIGAEVENYQEANKVANSAVNLLGLNDISQNLLDQGIITGTLGASKTQALKFLESFGLSSSEMEETIANTEAFFGFRGRAVAEVIKAFGAGTGLSDKDREYAQKIAAGEQALTEDAIAKLLYLERKYGEMAINRNNEIVSRMVNITGGNNKDAENFYIEMPKFTSVTANMQSLTPPPPQDDRMNSLVEKYIN